MIGSWRKEYNTVRPHSDLGYSPPAPPAYIPAFLPKPISQPHAVMSLPYSSSYKTSVGSTRRLFGSMVKRIKELPVGGG